MELRPNFDPEMNTLSINLQVGFLDQFYGNLKGMVEMKSENLPKNLSVKKTGKNSVEFSFSLPQNPDINKVSDNIMSVAIDDRAGHIRELHKLINNFINGGLKKLYNTTEFFPLRGYPQADFVKDLKESMKNKRNMCIIKDYSEYLKSQENKDISNIKYTQYMVEYGTEEWSDIALEVLSPDFSLEKFAKKYLPKCKLTEWT